MLPSGNDAAVVLATEFGRWLFLIGDKSRSTNMPYLGQNGRINNFSNCREDVEDTVNQAFKFPNRGHEDYIEAFVKEMNKQAKNLHLKKVNFCNPHGLQQKSNHASASDIICIMNYAMKYDLIRDVCSKNKYEC